MLSAMNNTDHTVTKTSPSKLLFGVEQRGKVVDEFTEYLDYKWGDKEVIDLHELRRKASDAILKSQEYNLNYFNKHHVPAKVFEVGDYVVIKNVDTSVGTNKNLIPKYSGPYVVKERLGHDRYVIEDVENFQVTQIPYHGILDSSRLRMWLEPGKVVDDVLDFESNTGE